MDEPRGHDEAAAGTDGIGVPVDRYFEAAFGDITRLHMRVRMQRPNSSSVKTELNLHQFGRRQQHPAAAAGRDLGPWRFARLGYPLLLAQCCLPVCAGSLSAGGSGG